MADILIVLYFMVINISIGTFFWHYSHVQVITP